jgi:two-component system, chemotaxis family, chemotaxis protein CheY
LKKLKVIIVDDSVTIRKIIKANLNKLGINEIFEASNGDDGFKLAKSLDANLAFFDYNMPGLNGVELTDKIRKDPKVSSLKIIAISSEFDDVVVSQFKTLGVHTFVDKPFDLSKFNEAVKPLMEEDDAKVGLTRDVIERLFGEGLKTATIDGNNLIFDFGKEKLTISIDIFTASALHYQELES